MLEDETKKSFKTQIIDGVIFFWEDFSYMNSSQLMIIARLQKINGSPDHCEVEIVTGGGGEGLFSITFGNEKRRMNKIVNLITDLCEHKDYKVSQMAMQ